MNIEKNEIIGGHLLRRISGILTGGALHQKKGWKTGSGQETRKIYFT